MASRLGGDRVTRPAPGAAFQLICACVRWPPSPSRAAAIRNAAATEIDPDLLARVARRHDVAIPVAAALRDADVAVPARLDRIAARRRLQALEQVGATIALDGRFAAAAIPVLVMKGVALSQRLYGSALMRGAADIDLAVRIDDVERAWGVMHDAGYAMRIPRQALSGGALRTFLWAAKDSLHRHAATGTIVELHWRVSDDLSKVALPSEDRWQAIRVSATAQLRMLGDDDLFAYLCTHGAAHLWARLKWLADIAALVGGTADGGARYWASARAAGAERPAASALMLANRLLGTALPDGFVAPRSWRLRLLNRLALRVMLAGDGATELAATPYRGWAEIVAKALVAPRWRNHTAILRRVAVSGEDVGELGLKGGLRLLYPLVRIPLMVRRRAARQKRRRTNRSAG